MKVGFVLVFSGHLFVIAFIHANFSESIFIYLFLCVFNLQLVKLDLCLRIKILKYAVKYLFVKYLILHPINIYEEWPYKIIFQFL